MYNFGLKKLEVSNVDNFTSNIGMKVRRTINAPLRQVLKMATKRDIVLEEYPQLEKEKPYIFAANHSFSEDAISDLVVIDRSAYMLVGTTDQLEHNPQMYMAWLNGLIYVNRLNSESRKDSLKKMERILNNGSSILMYPGGGYNNTENLLCETIFSGPYILSKNTGYQVVPIASYHDDKKIYIRIGEPLDLYKYEKEIAKELLRDSISTMLWYEMEEHAERLKRRDLIGDLHLHFMEERRKEYLEVNWTRDVWDEELTVYHKYDSPADSRIYLDNITVNKNNVGIIAKELVRREEDIKYDFKRYMKQKWNK